MRSNRDFWILLFLILCSSSVYGQNLALSDTVAGIWINYDESLIGDYTLPDPLRMAHGEKVTSPEMWLQKRRPEIIKLYEQHQFGRVPERPKDLWFDVFDPGTKAYDGKALRKQVTIHYSNKKATPTTDVLIYLPAKAKKPVPVFLYISFRPYCMMVDDPGVKRGFLWTRQGERIPAGDPVARHVIDIAPFLEEGFGFATLYYGDIDPDFKGGLPYGVRSLYLNPGQTKPGFDEWGTISAWSWGLSRVMDYFETDASIDEKKIALMGVSRLGKTVTWTGARDSRFGMIIASCSGEGGAALSRRNYGETIAHLAAPSRYFYQFCTNYGFWGTRVDEFPVDAHMLVACIAPRPVLLQTGTTDRWSDPRGEFLSAVAASPVFELLGKKGVGIKEMPPAGKPHLNTLGYYMHEGGHGTIDSDWEIFRQYMKKHFKR